MSLLTAEKFPLPVYPPNHMGVSSASILRFLDRLESAGICMHSYVLIRNHSILSEGYWAPYTAESLQRMYSVTKTFVGVAVGLLAQDGYIHLDDPLITYFRDKMTKQPSRYTQEMTIRDALMMCSVHTKTATQIVPHPDMLKAFFNVTPSHKAGTVFNYDTSASITLAALVERLTGMSLMDYLRMKVLDKIGFSNEAYCLKRGDVSDGGGGLLCTAHDLAKFALLCMQQGSWYGFQLLPKDYMKLATTRRVATNFANYQFNSYGYGYQMWMTAHNGFVLYGMGGQFAICLPEKNLILVTTADTLDNQGGLDVIFNSFWDTIYKELDEESVEDDEEAAEALYERISGLKIRPVEGETDSPIARAIGGKCFTMDTNTSVFQNVTIGFGPDYGTVTFDNDQGSHELRFGLGNYARQFFPGTRMEAAASGAWVDPETLFIRTYFTGENLGSLQLLLHFGGDGSLTIQSRPFGDTGLPASYNTCVTGFVYE
ncbi:MAG: serine hydrolase [Firmicutes bacterium]|nr:serine hydrolase [Bacillota bacterium]